MRHVRFLSPTGLPRRAPGTRVAPVCRPASQRT